ncbi:MAG: DUF2199 domain-containing protein [Pseudomonadota bacterium]
MQISDLQPLDKVIISQHVFGSSDSLIYVCHAHAGRLDFICNSVEDMDDFVVLCSAFLLVEFPQLRSLGDVPLGKIATFDVDKWRLDSIDYKERQNPGAFPLPTERTLADIRYTCVATGEEKIGLPEITYPGPAQLDDAQGNPNSQVLQSGQDLCSIRIDGKDHFWIRALLPLRIKDKCETWSFGVWASVSGEHFKRYEETLHQDQRDLGTMSGYLSNAVPGVPNSLDLDVSIVPNDPGMRPWLLLREPQVPHPLFDAQQEGISVDTLLEWVTPHLSNESNA